jgi:hypothetical protein
VFSKRKTQEPKKKKKKKLTYGNLQKEIKKKKKKKRRSKSNNIISENTWEIDITWLKLRIAKQNSVLSGVKAVAKTEIAVRSRITYLKPRLNGLSS